MLLVYYCIVPYAQLHKFQNHRVCIRIHDIVSLHCIFSTTVALDSVIGARTHWYKGAVKVDSNIEDDYEEQSPTHFPRCIPAPPLPHILGELISEVVQIPHLQNVHGVQTQSTAYYSD